MNIRRLALTAVAFSALAIPYSASAETYAMFFNGSFVDTSTEGTNMLNDVTGLGHTVNTFTGTAAGDFTTALAGVDGLILPEMEVANLNDSLDDATRDVLRQYVEGGGCLIQANYFAANSNLPNTLFGWSLSQAGGMGDSALNVANAAGTTFAGGPGTLEGNGTGADAVEGILKSSLPTGALSIYEDEFEVTSVFVAEVGLGHYIYLGFDWFENPTTANWVDVTDRALGYCVVPEPATMAALGLGALAMVRRRRKA